MKLLIMQFSPFSRHLIPPLFCNINIIYIVILQRLTASSSWCPPAPGAVGAGCSLPLGVKLPTHLLSTAEVNNGAATPRP
jgi:hypothetical protein